MSKYLPLAILLGGLAAIPACSGSSATPEPKAVKTLKVGDKAPPLKSVEWKNGAAMKFEPGHVYVLEFWAIWCGPCIAMMPHLGELQQEYKDKNLHIIPVTTLDVRNSRPAVNDFIAQRGPKLGLTFAVCETEETEETDHDYREMAGVDSFPATFVIGKDGTIAYIGRPMFLDDVLPKVVAGTWNGQADADRVAESSRRYEEILDKMRTRPESGIADLAAYEVKYPEKSNQTQFQTQKIDFLLIARKFDQAKSATEILLPKLIVDRKSRLLNEIRAAWTDPDLNPDRLHIGLAVTAAEAILKIEGATNPMAQYGAAEAYYAAGDLVKATAAAKLAVQYAENAEQKQNFEEIFGKLSLKITTRTMKVADKAIELKVGDKAPELKKVDWKNGTALKFEPGHVYVVDFWAIWCGPCIAMMPHLADIQHEYKEKKMHVVAVTTIEKRNPKREVENFVAKRGPKLGFPFAICDTDETDRDYREKAGLEGLPASFVVDKEGKIAYIGQPMFLDDVLPKVLDGTWKGQEDADRIAEMNKAFDAIIETLGTKPDTAVTDLAAFEAKYPDKASQLQFQTQKIVLLLQAQKYDQAKGVSETLMPKLIAGKKAYLLNNIRASWADADLNPNRKHVLLAVTAAEAILAIEGQTNPMALIGAAEAYYVAGDKAKAIETAKKAIQHAEDKDQKMYFEEELKRFEG